MGLIIRGLNAVIFPEQRKDAMAKAAGMKLADDFVDENYWELFAVERVNIDTEHRIFEIEFPDFESQKMINKVEKVFLVCASNFSQGNVITLESNPVTNMRHLCEAGPDGIHSNFGPVIDNEVYGRLKEII
jgi:hypothetical protein